MEWNVHVQVNANGNLHVNVHVSVNLVWCSVMLCNVAYPCPRTYLTVSVEPAAARAGPRRSVPAHVVDDEVGDDVDPHRVAPLHHRDELIPVVAI